MSNIGPYLTLEEIIGRKVTFPDLLQELTKIRRDDVLRWVAGMTAIVERKESSTPSDQLSLLHHLVPSDLFEEIHTALQTGQHTGAFFHRRQLWFVLQMALITCKDDIEPSSEDTLRQAFGKCCLMANDLLKQVEIVHGHDPEEAKTLSWLITALISFTDLRPMHEVFARAQLFWLEIPEEPAMRQFAASLGLDKTLDQVFEAKFGIPLREFMLFATIIYYKFAEAAVEELPKAAVYDPSLVFQGWFSEEHVSKSLALISATPDEAAARLLGSPRQSWANDFTPLSQKPLIEKTHQKYVCPDLHMFRNFFVQGIYELLLVAVSPARFRQFFGRIFERYIEQLITRFAPRSTVLANTFYAPIRFVGSEKDEAGDGLLVWPSIAVLFECKTSILTNRQRYAMSSGETTKAIDDQLAKFGKDRKGIGQLANSLFRILAGDSIRSNDSIIDLSSVSKIYPAIIVYDEVLGNHAVRVHLQQKLNDWLQEQNVDQSRIGHLLLFTIRDIEYFELLAQPIGAEKLMKDYVTFVDQNPINLHSMFTDFAKAKYPQANEQIGYTLATLDRVLKAVQVEGDRRRAIVREREAASGKSTTTHFGALGSAQHHSD